MTAGKNEMWKRWLPLGICVLLGALLYAGIRPERVDRAVTLDGFGIAPNQPEMAPERYQQWLGFIKKPPRMHVHPDRAAFVRRLMQQRAQLKLLHLSLIKRFGPREIEKVLRHHLCPTQRR